MTNFVTGIISMSIGAVVLASVFITQVKSTLSINDSTCAGISNGSVCVGQTWSLAEVSLWGLVSLIGIAGFIYGVMNVFGMN